MDKKEFRKFAITNRDEVENKACKSEQICENLIKISEYANAKTIFSYMNIKSEVQTNSINQLILDKKKTLALPKVYNDVLQFKKLQDIKENTEKCAYGILEPKENLEKINCFDVILVPAVAFSKQGHRMGYGAGFYDRYLQNKSGIKIGICYDEQIYEKIPYDEYDIIMDYLVTPTSTYSFTKQD